MRRILFFFRLTGITLGKLCRQRMLLAGVTLLCVFLPLFLGSAAQEALSGGVNFDGLNLAITAPEGDTVPRQLEMLLGQMRDVSQYCAVTAMDYDRALESLEAGEVSAVLVLPEAFVSGVMDGTNPDITLILAPDRPLEGLLTLWVGQSATDLLAAVQAGIYGVLELYQQHPSENLSFQDVMVQINLRYINWSLGRQDMFRTRQIQPVDNMTIERHYSLSLLCFLMLAMGAFYLPVYDGGWVTAQNRLRAAGWGATSGFLAAMSSCILVNTAVLTAAQAFLVGGFRWGMVPVALVCGAFCGAFVSLCCLVTDRAGSCGILSFGLALILLGLSGGILPPAMMPASLRPWIQWSPVTWMRNLMALDKGLWNREAGLLLAATAMLVLPAMVLYGQRSRKEVAGQ